MGLNVVWIVSDTFRPDCLGLDGGAAHTPNLDALAQRSHRFARAQVASFPTVPARGDFLTGKYAFTDWGWSALPRELSTVPELAGQAGVVTVGVVDTPFFVQKGFNYDRGFSYFYDLPTQLEYGSSDTKKQRQAASVYFPRGATLVPTPRVTEFDYAVAQTMTTAERCLEYLREDQFLLYVDTWDPHEPFDPPAWYVERYRPDYDGRTVYPVYGPYEEFGVSRADVELAWDCYLGKVTMCDRWIGRLIDRLDTLNLLDSTAIVFSSDHGFQFGERGLFGKMMATEPHGLRWARSPLYGQLSNVPLWIAMPDGAGAMDNRLASNVDLGPTVLELLGVTVPEGLAGRSLAPLLDDPDATARDVAVTAAPLATPGEHVALVDDVIRNVDQWQPITVTTERWSLLFSRQEDPIELYDLDADPDQKTNVADQHPGVVHDLHAKLIEELVAAGTPGAAVDARR